MKQWNILSTLPVDALTPDTVMEVILKQRGCRTQKDRDLFLHPIDPLKLTPKDVGIDAREMKKAVARIKKAISLNESIVVYADYDADGVSAGALLWEALYQHGARVMPYIPHRVDEGYGFSEKGITQVQTQFDPTLIITVDHGITAVSHVAYAQKKGIDVIVTDHHVEQQRNPDCTIVHTTQLSGAGVAWMLAKEFVGQEKARDLVGLAAIGTIADMVLLLGANRSIAFYGLAELRRTKRFGIVELMADAAILQDTLSATEVSHMIAPRLNAMGRLEHALDALRLLCTTNQQRAKVLAKTMGLTNRERQQMTMDMARQAIKTVSSSWKENHILIVADPSYNQGVIGLVAGKLVEQYARPAIVISIGDGYSKGSARSMNGVNIIEFIRSQSRLLVDAGGHPMAAGFTIETKNIERFQRALEKKAKKIIPESLLVHNLAIACELPWSVVSEKLWRRISELAPFGIGNWEPVFSSLHVTVSGIRRIGVNQSHVKFIFQAEGGKQIDAVGFGMGEVCERIHIGDKIDVAYTIDMNEWNGKRSLQLKLKDVSLVKHE